MSGSELRVTPATSDDWADVETVFGTRGDAARCWCRYFIERDGPWTTERNRAALRRDVAEQDPPAGLIARRDGVPVGWVQLGPVGRFPRWPARDTDPEEGVWALTCFVVPVGHRRSGVARGLLRSAIDEARDRGAPVLRARPTDTTRAKKASNDLYTGVLSTFLAEGFEVLDRTRSMTLVELRLDR